MPVFGARSLASLAHVHPDLRKAADEAIKDVDFTVIEGRRGRAAQTAAYKNGASRAKFGQSPHNYAKALAFDFIPHPFGGWGDVKSFKRVADAIVKAGERVGVKLRPGYTFKSIVDFPHIELSDWKAMKGPLAP